MRTVHASALYATGLLLTLALPGAWWLAGLPWLVRWPRAVVLRGLMVASLILPLGNALAWAIGRLAGSSVQPVAVNESVMALVVLFYPVVALWTQEPTHLECIWFVGFAIALGLSAYITGVIAWGLGVTLWVALHTRPRRLRWGVVSISIVALGVVLAWAALTPGLLGPRTEIWSVGWQMFSGAPLTGQGVGAFANHWRAAFPRWPPYTHAHNLPLHLLAETGLLGLGAFAAVVWAIVWQLWKRRAEPWAQGALCSLVACGGIGLADNPLSIGFVTVLLAVVVWLGVGDER
jgi:O-antigen ligase